MVLNLMTILTRRFCVAECFLPVQDVIKIPAYERAIILFNPLKQLPDKCHPVYGNASLARSGCGTYAQTAGVNHEGAGDW
jgi:hypothetical protein